MSPDSLPPGLGIVAQTLADSGKVLRFIRDQYGDQYFGANETFFKWLYIDVPCDWFLRKSSEGILPANAVCNDSGEILAVHIFVPFDAVTHWGGGAGVFDEEWINGSNIRGLGRKLASHLASEVDIYCGYGCNDLSENAFRQMGFSFYDELPRLVTVFHPGKLSEMVSVAGYLDEANGILNGGGHGSGARYYKLPCAAQMAKATVDNYNASLAYGVRRSIDWLDWRYDKHPHFHYDVIAATADGEDGIAIVRIETIANSVERVARIVDLLALPGHEVEIFAAALSFAHEQGCLLADMMTTDWRLAEVVEQGLRRRDCAVQRNPRVPYMFQPLAFGESNNVNMAIRSRIPFDLRTFRAFKGDGTQDILRTAASAAVLNRK